MNSILSYFQEVKIEISKVVWPKRKDVIKLTIIVFLVSAIVGGYVGVLDYIFTNILKKVLNG